MQEALRCCFKTVRFIRQRILRLSVQILVLVLVFGITFGDIQGIFKLPFLPTIHKAEAATGDIAVFRQAGGTQTVPASGTPFSMPWDTTVQSNSNIALQGNNQDIQLTDGGKYLVMYSGWAGVGTSTGTNRRSIDTYLTVNGTRSPYGQGAGYIRDTQNDNTAYAASGAIINANAGDLLQLQLKRTDANTTAGSNVNVNSDGISIVKLKDSWDYLRIRAAATSSSISANTSFTSVQFDTSDETDTGSFGFTPTSGNITLKGAAGTHFLIMTNVGLRQTAASGNRQNYEMELSLNGTEIPGTRTTSYVRGNANSNATYTGTLVYTGIITKTSSADQTLTINVRRESSTAATTVIVGGQTSVSAVALPSTAEYLSLGDSSGTQALSSTRTAFTWNTNNEVDTTAFSHSTTSNPSRITVNQAGNYLFFSTVYDQTVTSGNTRQPTRVDWRLNGSSLLNYGGHGGENRASGTFTDGSSGGLVMAGLSASDYVEVTQIDEASVAPVDATFQANRIAVQGVALNSQFFGTDVTVSAKGSQTRDIKTPQTNIYNGGAFVVQENTSSRTVTGVTITQTGSVDASTGINNVKLFYDLDTSAPYDCSAQSYNGTEPQFGTTHTGGFSGPNGTVSFTGSVTISTTQSLCLYVVYDTTGTATDGQTVAFSINDPAIDISASGAPTYTPLTPVVPTGVTTLHNAELTQVHYHWRNDDGSETTATPVDPSEDTPALGFANGTVRRLRVEVNNAGSTTSDPTSYQLQYAQKVSTCSAATGWTNVASGNDWSMATTANLTNGADTTNIAVASGGVTDANTTFLTPNGGVRDTSSVTSPLTLLDTQFVELEYAIEPSATAPQGNTYCFRVTNAGTPLRNYSVYPEGTISADIAVTASSSQVATLDVGSTNQYLGGTFVIKRGGTSRTLTSIKLTQSGTINGATNLKNVKILYDLDTTAPYDCSAQSYSGTEPQFGSTATNGFSSATGTATFTGSVALTSTQTFCGYVVLDVGSGAHNGDTIDIGIVNPSTDVVVTGSTVGPSSNVSPTGSTNVAGQILTQTGYHWRNDNGTEITASSASAGVENTPIINISKGVTKRLRLQVANTGSVTSVSTKYRLEYGTKVTTCDAVGTWTEVGTTTAAFAMATSAYLTDGANTTNIVGTSSGAVSDPGGYSFVTPNGGQKDTSPQTTGLVLSPNSFTELEYSIKATTYAGDSTDYCFRVTDAGSPLDTYTYYPELNTSQKQDFYTQTGQVSISGTSTTLRAGTDYIAPSASTSAFIRITNSQITGAGNDTGGGNQTPQNITAYILNPSNIKNSITIARPATATGDTVVTWEIIEFIGTAGTDNEMKVLSQGALTYGATSLTATGTVVSGVSNNGKVAVIITGQINPSTNAANFNEMLSTAKWNATTSSPVFTRSWTGDATGLSYAVVEFSGANWNVQRVSHTYSAAGVVETTNITPVSSLSTTFVFTQKRVAASSESGLAHTGQQAWLSSIGVASFELQSGVVNPTLHTTVLWVIENTQTGSGAMQVYRSNGSLLTTTSACGGVEPCSQDVSIGGTLSSVNNASVFMNNFSAGTGTAFPRVVVGVHITSTTAYTTFRSDTGQQQDFRTEVVEWPVATITYRQDYYRFYTDNGSLTPTDPWPPGASDLGENTSITGTDNPLGSTDKIRIRMSIKINNASLPAATQSFKLQYGKEVTTCSAISTWTDIGSPSSGEIWRGYVHTVTDGTALATSTPAPGTLLLSVSTVAGTYQNNNPSAVNPYAADLGQDIEYDWSVEQNGAPQLTNYCFRMVHSDGTTLTSYINYPILRTTGYTPVVADWRFYSDATNTTPINPLAAEKTAPSSLSDNTPVKLRVTAAEVEGEPGLNVKFGLQYSQYADFSDGGHFLISTTTCVASSTWCYFNGGGTDNATVTAAVLSDSDSCVAGVGNGCGTHNEAATTTSTHYQPAFSKMEYEFTLKPVDAQPGAVYYFRPYDITDNFPLAASTTYPSVIAEPATLTFTVSGVSAGATVSGVTMNATTSATSVAFGALPFNVPYYVAQSLNVNTNATQGYKLYVSADQPLTNQYGSTIPYVAGTNASPTGWSIGCSATSTGCFGYHSTDAVLSGSSNRFAPNDSYAALSTTSQEVMYSPVPINDIHDMVYALQVSNLQPAGQYTDTITYIAAPVF